uniref:histone acetyltransferase n=1 Tax=Globodera rostochiensis TaxID=31243 RepID=A0A914I517_GLORO
MDSPNSEASFDVVDILAAERGGDGTFEVEEKGGDELGAAAAQQGQTKSGQLLERQLLLKMEQDQMEQRHNQTEICVQIGEMKNLVGPVAAGALTEQCRAEADQLMIDHEATRAEIAEMKRLQEMQEQRQAQMLLRLDELCKAFSGGSVLLESANSFGVGSSGGSMGPEGIGPAGREGPSPLAIAGMKTVKEGTEDGGTKAIAIGQQQPSSSASVGGLSSVVGMCGGGASASSSIGGGPLSLFGSPPPSPSSAMKNLLDGYTPNTSNSFLSINPPNRVGQFPQQMDVDGAVGFGCAGEGPRDWHASITPDLRNHLVGKLVKAIFPYPNPEAIRDRRIRDLLCYARKVENDIFETANDTEAYFHMLAEKIYKLQKELQEKKNRRRHEAELAAAAAAAAAGL